MKTKGNFFFIIFIFLITCCNSGDGNNVVNDEFVGSRDFTFNTDIDPTTLTQEDSFRLYSYVPSFAPMPEAYAIESNEDLVVFNQTHTSDEDEYVSLDNLDTYTYFFIRDPGCPDYFDYSDHSYSNNVLTITLDRFHEPNVECPAEYVELYLVFKARKGTVNDSNPDLLISSGTRDLSPNNTGDELDLFVRDNNAFAFDLYHAVSGEDENMLFSPYSISVAMAMTWAGARDQTETQMADTLRFNFPQEKLHSLFNELDLDLNNRNQNDPENSDKYLKLNIVNQVWSQEDYPFVETYLDTLMFNYGAGIRLVDFMYNPERARLDINEWIAGQTENRIEDLLNQGDVTIYTRLVLTNVIYFNASWGIPFNPDDTYDGVFHLEDGTSVTVPMMIAQGRRGENGEMYAATQGSDYQAVELPYYGDDFSMVIIVPDNGMFGAFEQDLDSSVIDEIIGNLEVQGVALRMPKFEYESRINLAGTLSEMGMPDAFIPDVADFSGMDGSLNLFISKVIHQASITLDEAGTEAAAATAVVMTYGSVTDPLKITIDRPFIYMIRDNLTGTILFLGRIKNP
jgi:serpin B